VAKLLAIGLVGLLVSLVMVMFRIWADLAQLCKEVLKVDLSRRDGLL
jgi:hypothetical protein